jgi:hypothetical protein
MKRYCSMPSGTADMLNALTNVRFWGQSGQRGSTPAGCISANVSAKHRAIGAAGFAKLVEVVNQ